MYDGGGYGEAELLRSSYRESLRLASEAGLESVAFPCISTGVYGYPKAEACEVAVSAVAEWLATHELPRVVTFCCFGFEDAGALSRSVDCPVTLEAVRRFGQPLVHAPPPPRETWFGVYRHKCLQCNDLRVPIP